MKDDKFNKLMEKYVDSTKRGADTDLRKLKNRSQDNVKARRPIPKYVWATCAAILVVVISLSVALPIVLNKKGEEEAPKYFYCDIFNTNEIEINELSELIDDHNFSCLLPAINFFSSYITVMINKDDNVEYGAFIGISVFDENFDGITINVIKKPYILTQLESFDFFTDSAQWRNTTAKYQIIENEDNYSHAIKFATDNYSYFINFDSYSELSAVQALDLIYGENGKA